MTAVPCSSRARRRHRAPARCSRTSLFSGAHRGRGGRAQQAAREPHVARHSVRRRVGDRDARDRQRRRAGDSRADEAARREQHRHHADRRAEGRQGRQGPTARSSEAVHARARRSSTPQAIRATIPDVGATSSEVVVNSVITREGHHRSGKIVGVDSSYFDVMNLKLAEGAQVRARTSRRRRPVTIIGQGVKSRFFTTERSDRPARSRSATQWLTVVGVLEDRKVSTETAKRLGIRDANMDVYVPLPTMLLRYRNRARGDAAGDGARGARVEQRRVDSTRDRRPARREAELPPARQGHRAGRQVDAP